MTRPVEEKKILVRLFFMYMPYIKFQDSSIRFVHKVVPIQNIIIEINLVSLCFIKIYKISFVFLYLSSYGKVRWSRLADVQ